MTDKKTCIDDCLWLDCGGCVNDKVPKQIKILSYWENEPCEFFEEDEAYKIEKAAGYYL